MLLQITTEPCGQICLPSANSTTLGSAYFEDSGDVIRVNLSTAAAEISLPCTVLFGGDANKELGSSAECRATGQVRSFVHLITQMHGPGVSDLKAFLIVNFFDVELYQQTDLCSNWN